jgi:hypothetical protein
MFRLEGLLSEFIAESIPEGSEKDSFMPYRYRGHLKPPLLTNIFGGFFPLVAKDGSGPRSLQAGQWNSGFRWYSSKMHEKI